MNLSSIVFDNSLISEAFYHVLEYSNSEIIITDKNLNIIFQNSKFNFKNQKFSISELAHNQSNKNLNYHFSKFRASDKNHLFFKLILNDENNSIDVPLNVHICKIKDKKDNLNGFSVIIQDITQELKNNMQKQSMIDVLMHDLKNPVRANIQVLEQLSKNKFGIIDDNIRFVIDELLNSCKFLNYMMDNLIIKYKNEYSMQEILKEKRSLVDLVKQRCNNLLGFFDRRKQYIELIVEDKIPMLYFDFEAVEKVINNLLINASEQSVDNSKIIVLIKKIEEYISVSFINNGYFETDENLNNIFDEYITCTNKFRKIGFGLELFNCKKVIEAHQGKIWAERINEQGTSITFCLPV